MRERSRKAWFALAGVVAVAAIAGVMLWLLAPGAPANGPVPVAWDKTPCAHCAMHVGEPAFAAQLQTQDGQVLDFDDPGCLFRYLAEKRPEPSAMYFHHVSEDRWLSRAEAGFVSHSPTPMGYGFAAVDRAAPGALSLESAQAAVLTRTKPIQGSP